MAVVTQGQTHMAPTESFEKLDPAEVHFCIPGPIEGLHLFLRTLPTIHPLAEPERFFSYTACRFHRPYPLPIASIDAPGAMSSATQASTFGVWIFTALGIQAATPK